MISTNSCTFIQRAHWRLPLASLAMRRRFLSDDLLARARARARAQRSVAHRALAIPSHAFRTHGSRITDATSRDPVVVPGRPASAGRVEGPPARCVVCRVLTSGSCGRDCQRRSHRQAVVGGRHVVPSHLRGPHRDGAARSVRHCGPAAAELGRRRPAEAVDGADERGAHCSRRGRRLRADARGSRPLSPTPPLDRQCANTFDAHGDKAWALAVRGDGRQVITGGSDSIINVWQDCTHQEVEAEVQKKEKELLLEQDLLNAMRLKEHKRVRPLLAPRPCGPPACSPFPPSLRRADSRGRPSRWPSSWTSQCGFSRSLSL